jgi:hypothetical protein
MKLEHHYVSETGPVPVFRCIKLGGRLKDKKVLFYYLFLTFPHPNFLHLRTGTEPVSET